jgi:hypothetical protein
MRESRVNGGKSVGKKTSSSSASDGEEKQAASQETNWFSPGPDLSGHLIEIIDTIVDNCEEHIRPVIAKHDKLLKFILYTKYQALVSASRLFPDDAFAKDLFRVTKVEGNYTWCHRIKILDDGSKSNIQLMAMAADLFVNCKMKEYDEGQDISHRLQVFKIRVCDQLLEVLNLIHNVTTVHRYPLSEASINYLTAVVQRALLFVDNIDVVVGRKTLYNLMSERYSAEIKNAPSFFYCLLDTFIRSLGFAVYAAFNMHEGDLEEFLNTSESYLFHDKADNNPVIPAAETMLPTESHAPGDDLNSRKIHSLFNSMANALETIQTHWLYFSMEAFAFSHYNLSIEAGTDVCVNISLAPVSLKPNNFSHDDIRVFSIGDDGKPVNVKPLHPLMKTSPNQDGYHPTGNLFGGIQRSSQRRGEPGKSRSDLGQQYSTTCPVEPLNAKTLYTCISFGSPASAYRCLTGWAAALVSMNEGGLLHYSVQGSGHDDPERLTKARLDCIKNAIWNKLTKEQQRRIGGEEKIHIVNEFDAGLETSDGSIISKADGFTGASKKGGHEIAVPEVMKMLNAKDEKQTFYSLPTNPRCLQYDTPMEQDPGGTFERKYLTVVDHVKVDVENAISEFTSKKLPEVSARCQCLLTLIEEFNEIVKKLKLSNSKLLADGFLYHGKVERVLYLHHMQPLFEAIKVHYELLVNMPHFKSFNFNEDVLQILNFFSIRGCASCANRGYITVIEQLAIDIYSIRLYEEINSSLLTHNVAGLNEDQVAKAQKKAATESGKPWLLVERLLAGVWNLPAVSGSSDVAPKSHGLYKPYKRGGWGEQQKDFPKKFCSLFLGGGKGKNFGDKYKEPILQLGQGGGKSNSAKRKAKAEAEAEAGAHQYIVNFFNYMKLESPDYNRPFVDSAQFY